MTYPLVFRGDGVGWVASEGRKNRAQAQASYVAGSPVPLLASVLQAAS